EPVSQAKAVAMDPELELTPYLRQCLELLLHDPWRSPHDLEGSVDAYLQGLKASCAEPDLALAHKLAACLKEVLHDPRHQAVESHRKLIQAAVNYFVIRQDATPDDAPGGLQDD